MVDTYAAATTKSTMVRTKLCENNPAIIHFIGYGEVERGCEYEDSLLDRTAH